MDHNSRSLRPRARCRALTYNIYLRFHFEYRIPFAYDAACSVAGRTTLFELGLYLPHLSLCIAYIVLLRTRICINTPRVASPKGRQIGPHFPFVFVCVSGPFCLISSLLYVSSSLVRPDPAYRHSPQPSANPCVPFTRYKLTLAFRSLPHHTCLRQRE